MSWSGGKDSNFALFHLLNDPTFEVVGLLTTLFTPTGRVSMHGTPVNLIKLQAECIGLPLTIVEFSDSSYEAYEVAMKEALIKFKSEGVNVVGFGDIFLEDLKQYRDDKLAEVNMKGYYPLWKKNTQELSAAFIAKGFKTHICSIDLSKIPETLCGVDYSVDFLSKLAPEIDPCGENGEFHSFCYDGPIFNKRVKFSINGISEHSYENNGQTYTYLFSDLTV